MSDFGLSRPLLESDYYLTKEAEGGGRIPVRWTAPEALKWLKYTHQSGKYTALSLLSSLRLYYANCLMYELQMCGHLE